MRVAEFTLRVLTPDKRFWDGPAYQIVFSTTEGSMGVMAGHAATIAAVAEGTLAIYDAENHSRVAAISQGFAEIRGSLVELFVDSVEWADEIDTARAAEALRRAEERLRHKLSRVEYLRTQTAVARASARLKAAENKE